MKKPSEEILAAFSELASALDEAYSDDARANEVKAPLLAWGASLPSLPRADIDRENLKVLVTILVRFNYHDDVTAKERALMEQLINWVDTNDVSLEAYELIYEGAWRMGIYQSWEYAEARRCVKDEVDDLIRRREELLSEPQSIKAHARFTSDNDETVRQKLQQDLESLRALAQRRQARRQAQRRAWQVARRRGMLRPV
jgi:hypothetical protein